ncbi:MAG: hypothetical protein ACFFD1_00895 [Candidatus Thorarchaeota archaeon]
MNKGYTITKVVTKNFIMDLIAKIQNMLGMNLIAYEKMVQKGMQQIQEDIQEKNLKFKWYRYEITQLTNGAVSITLYGDLI